MLKARVVIGAGYGDEGKGLITDYLSNEDSMVVRFNGGAQAGHTVVTPNGLRHVFSHFGAGTLRGAGTFLSKHFVASPMLFVKELVKLGDILEHRPKVFIDRQAYITTPYDMLLNQAIENNRGIDRHGSCGVGFGETIERSEKYDGFILQAGDLEDRAFVRQMLIKIRDSYVPRRLAKLNMKDAVINYLNDDQILEAFMANVDTMLAFAEIADLDMLKGNENLVFEGAQGLALDQTHAYANFPHVTRSNCGLKNVIELARSLDIEKLDVNYITRCYTTRHGAGPLSGEVMELPHMTVHDKTNIFNEFQQELRFAPLDVEQLQTRITDDIIDSFGSGLTISPRLAVTCMDQMWENRGELRISGKRHAKLSRDAFLELLATEVGIKDYFHSTGPTRDDVYGYITTESII